MGIFARRAETLPRPKSQIQETLYLLLTYPKGLTRKDFMDKAWIMNAPEAIRVLRHNKRVWVDTVRIKHTNKFGREVEYGRYQIPERLRGEARKAYLKMNGDGEE